MADTSTRLFRASLRGRLHRDVEPPSSGSLENPAVAIVSAFPKLGKKMLFLFAYGDQWRFKVELIGLGQKEPRAAYPRVVKQAGEAPAQYPGLEEDEQE